MRSGVLGKGGDDMDFVLMIWGKGGRIGGVDVFNEFCSWEGGEMYCGGGKGVWEVWC